MLMKGFTPTIFRGRRAKRFLNKWRGELLENKKEPYSLANMAIKAGSFKASSTGARRELPP